MNNVFEMFNFALAQMVRLEQIMPGSGLGPTRKEVIMNAIQIAAKVGEGMAAVNPMVAMVSLFIDTTVGILNKSGVFKKAVAKVVTPVPVVNTVSGTVTASAR